MVRSGVRTLALSAQGGVIVHAEKTSACTGWTGHWTTLDGVLGRFR